MIIIIHGFGWDFGTLYPEIMSCSGGVAAKSQGIQSEIGLEGCKIRVFHQLALYGFIGLCQPNVIPATILCYVSIVDRIPEIFPVGPTVKFCPPLLAKQRKGPKRGLTADLGPNLAFAYNVWGGGRNFTMGLSGTGWQIMWSEDLVHKMWNSDPLRWHNREKPFLLLFTVEFII